MANQSKATYPSMPTSSWHKLREQFKRTIPSVVTDSYISSVFDITEKSARSNILPSLRYTGLIDNEGKPTDLAVKWRDDGQYQEVCEQMRREIYSSELIDLGYDNASQRNEIQRWFANSIKVGATAARKMTSFYLLLCESDPNKVAPKKATPKKVAPKKVTQSNEQKTKAKADRQGEHSSTSESQDSTELQGASRVIQENRGPELHFNIQIHISPDSTVDQIDAVFASMAKHLSSLTQR